MGKIVLFVIFIISSVEFCVVYLFKLFSVSG